MDISFTGIPLPPSSNNCYANGRRGGRFKSLKMRLWERDFATWAIEYAQTFAIARSLLAPRLKPGMVLAVHCTFYFKRSRILTKDGRPKKNDTSNYLKGLHDALSGALGIDDSWFFDGTMRKRPAEALIGHDGSEMVEVKVELLEAPWV
jgi:Holliday junction resolvase RusA-like endonuclease